VLRELLHVSASFPIESGSLLSVGSKTSARLRYEDTNIKTFIMKCRLSFLLLVLATLQVVASFYSPVKHPSGLSSTVSAPQKSARLNAFLGAPICEYHQVDIPTSQSGPPRQAISVEDLTPKLKSMLEESGMKQGVVNIISRHTTTAITINEREKRLAQDMEQYFLSIAPPDERSEADTAKAGVRYYHNDIDQRPDSQEEAQRCRENGFDIDNPDKLMAWRDQEPINAHSHLLSMLLGSSESIPVVDGEMVIGQWQSILLVDLDGPRDRTVAVQFLGYQ
jgi:thiamine phosphate synthase YjbQ (UPF0047 family)